MGKEKRIMAKNTNKKETTAVVTPAVAEIIPGTGWAVGRMKEGMFNDRITAHSIPNKEDALKRAGTDPERFVLHIDQIIEVGAKKTKSGKTEPEDPAKTD